MISLVVPVFNESSGLPEFWNRVQAVGHSLGEPFEVVFVDDGSSDGSFEILAALARTHAEIKVLRLTRNFGQQAALSAGLRHTTGRLVVPLDADLQDPPELVPRLIEACDSGFAVAYAVRRTRRGGLVKRGAYWLFYRMLRSMADVHIPLDAGDFCAMRRDLVEHLNALPERCRYLRGLRAWVGYPQCAVPYDRPERSAGQPAYTLPKLIGLAMDGITAFSYKPLRIFGGFGVALATVSFLTLGLFSVAKVFDLRVTGLDLGQIPGFFYLFCLIGFLGGVQIAGLGLLGEYVGRIFDESKQRPPYLIRDRINLPD